jgi:hypothetical protein
MYVGFNPFDVSCFCFTRFSSHLIEIQCEKRPFLAEVFVSSTDAMIGRHCPTGWLIFGINSVYAKNHLQFVALVRLVWRFNNLESPSI